MLCYQNDLDYDAALTKLNQALRDFKIMRLGITLFNDNDATTFGMIKELIKKAGV